VIGLIATQLAKEFQRPALVGHLDDEGLIHGSARIPEGSSVNLAAVFAEVSDLVVRAGGHAAAAGFVVESSKAELFHAAVDRKSAGFQAKLQEKEYDADAAIPELNNEFMSSYSNLEPFGKDFPAATLRISGAIVSDRRELRGGHLKLNLTQKSRGLDALAFHPPLEWLEIKNGECVDALVEPQWNYFRGQKQIQLLVRSLKRTST
jgi:single-stranded-DNA-specific exonuclease